MFTSAWWFCWQSSERTRVLGEQALWHKRTNSCFLEEQPFAEAHWPTALSSLFTLIWSGKPDCAVMRSLQFREVGEWSVGASSNGCSQRQWPFGFRLWHLLSSFPFVYDLYLPLSQNIIYYISILCFCSRRQQKWGSHPDLGQNQTCLAVARLIHHIPLIISWDFQWKVNLDFILKNTTYKS